MLKAWDELIPLPICIAFEGSVARLIVAVFKPGLEVFGQLPLGCRGDFSQILCRPGPRLIFI